MQYLLRLKLRGRVLFSFSGVVALSLIIAGFASSSATAKSHAYSVRTRASSSAHLKIAYLSFAVDNSYDAPMLAAAKKVAAADNASIQVFDAKNNPATQYSQFQDAITQGGFSGIITQPIESTNLIPLVKQAVAKHIKVVNIDQIMGAKLDTSAVQVSGLSGNVTFDPYLMGQDLGKLAVAACASKHLNPCNVGYLYDIQASSLDIAIRDGFNNTTAGHHVDVVETGQDYFTPTDGLTAVQNMLTANPKINMIAGSDQGIEGAALDTGRPKNVLLVGYGGSAAGIKGVKAGTWYGTVKQDPATEGSVGMQTLINAIRNNKKYPGENPLETLPNGGIITKSDVSLFTGEWPG
jgi:ribose transport system substrate-binding protein